MSKYHYNQFTGLRSRLTIGQIKSIIRDSEDKYIRELFTEILSRMLGYKVGWMYLMWKYEDMNFGISQIGWICEECNTTIDETDGCKCGKNVYPQRYKDMFGGHHKSIEVKKD